MADREKIQRLEAKLRGQREAAEALRREGDEVLLSHVERFMDAFSTVDTAELIAGIREITDGAESEAE